MFGKIIDPDERTTEMDAVDIKVDAQRAVSAYYSFITDEVEQWLSTGVFVLLRRRFLVRPLGVPGYYFGIDSEVVKLIRDSTFELERLADVLEIFQQSSELPEDIELSIGLDGTILGSIAGFKRAEALASLGPWPCW
jgi:hypothetical protein